MVGDNHLIVAVLQLVILYSIDGKSSVQYLYNVELENTYDNYAMYSILCILVALLIEVLFHFCNSRSIPSNVLKTFSSASFVKNISLILG